MEHKKPFLKRVTTFFANLWLSVKNPFRSSFEECFSKENIKKAWKWRVSEFKKAFKEAFNSKFFKACLVVLVIGLVFVGIWCGFVHSNRLGWWLVILTAIWLIWYSIAKEISIADYPVLSASMGTIGVMAVFCILFFIGKWVACMFNVTPDNPEGFAGLGFTSLLCLGLVALVFYGLYCIYNPKKYTKDCPKGHRDPDKTFPKFILWLIKWTLVLALITGLCWFLITKLVPLIG